MTAALEASRAGDAAPEAPHPGDPEVAAVLRQALSHHGAPARLAERLVDSALAVEAVDPHMAFAGAVDTHFSFRPLPADGGGQPIMLVGPPGAGKTVTAAKLAARSALAGQAPDVITTDTRRAGGVEQLAAFTRILEVELHTAETPAAMAAAVGECRVDAATVIDTAGTNPFSEDEMGRLGALVTAARAEPILVLAAGGDAFEMADTATAFAAIGATRLLVTRIDLARRFGGLLAAGDASGASFCNVSITADVAQGLSPINPVSLARLIVPVAGAGAEFRYEAAS